MLHNSFYSTLSGSYKSLLCKISAPAIARIFLYLAYGTFKRYFRKSSFRWGFLYPWCGTHVPVFHFKKNHFWRMRDTKTSHVSFANSLIFWFTCNYILSLNSRGANLWPFASHFVVLVLVRFGGCRLGRPDGLREFSLRSVMDRFISVFLNFYLQGFDLSWRPDFKFSVIFTRSYSSFFKC